MRDGVDVVLFEFWYYLRRGFALSKVVSLGRLYLDDGSVDIKIDFSSW